MFMCTKTFKETWDKSNNLLTQSPNLKVHVGQRAGGCKM